MPSKLAFQSENPRSPVAAMQQKVRLFVFRGCYSAGFCRILSPASASKGLSCASDFVTSWEASHARSVLCSSCRGQTPFLCLGPWGCGPNTTKIFFSVMNVLSGGLASPSQDRRGTRQRRKQGLSHLLLGGYLGSCPVPWGKEGWQVRKWLRHLSPEEEGRSPW